MVPGVVARVLLRGARGSWSVARVLLCVAREPGVVARVFAMRLLGNLGWLLGCCYAVLG